MLVALFCGLPSPFSEAFSLPSPSFLIPGTYADCLFYVCALPSSLFTVEDPLVQIIEQLLWTFLVKLLIPLGLGFFLLRDLGTW